MKEFAFFNQECLTFYDIIPSSFMEEGRSPLFMESRRFSSKTEGEGDVLFACYDIFFHLDSQVAHIFCFMMCLTVIRVVTYVALGWLFVQVERGQSSCLLKDGS